MATVSSEDQVHFLKSISLDLHSFYTVCEDIFLDITKAEEDVPKGEEWYKQLLLGMPDVKPPVISPSLADQLMEYLKFRHLIRHRIPLEMDEREMMPLLEKISHIGELFMEQLEHFLQFLENPPPFPYLAFCQPLGTPPGFMFNLPFPDITLGSSTTENGLVQILNVGDQPLVINQGGRRPEITNLSFTIVGFDLDGVIPPLEFPLDPNPDVPAPEITLAPGDLVFMLVKFTGLAVGPQVGAIRIFTNEPTEDPNNPPAVLKNVRGTVVPQHSVG